MSLSFLDRLLTSVALFLTVCSINIFLKNWKNQKELYYIFASFFLKYVSESQKYISLYFKMEAFFLFQENLNKWCQIRMHKMTLLTFHKKY